MEGFGYALWLEPEENERQQLRAIIQQLGKMMGGPIFDPHLTILAKNEGEVAVLLKRMHVLLEGASAFPITLLRAECRANWNRCLYLRAEDTMELRTLNGKAQILFETSGEFMPHVSILYGEYPQEKKEELLQEMGYTLPRTILMNAVSFVDCHGQPEEWQVIERCAL